jgi:hypothetical protein
MSEPSVSAALLLLLLLLFLSLQMQRGLECPLCAPTALKLAAGLDGHLAGTNLRIANFTLGFAFARALADQQHTADMQAEQQGQQVQGEVHVPQVQHCCSGCTVQHDLESQQQGLQDQQQRQQVQVQVQGEAHVPQVQHCCMVQHDLEGQQHDMESQQQGQQVQVQVEEEVHVPQEQQVQHNLEAAQQGLLVQLDSEPEDEDDFFEDVSSEIVAEEEQVQEAVVVVVAAPPAVGDAAPAPAPAASAAAAAAPAAPVQQRKQPAVLPAAKGSNKSGSKAHCWSFSGALDVMALLLLLSLWGCWTMPYHPVTAPHSSSSTISSGSSYSFYSSINSYAAMSHNSSSTGLLSDSMMMPGLQVSPAILLASPSWLLGSAAGHTMIPAVMFDLSTAGQSASSQCAVGASMALNIVTLDLDLPVGTSVSRALLFVHTAARAAARGPRGTCAAAVNSTAAGRNAANMHFLGVCAVRESGCLPHTPLLPQCLGVSSSSSSESALSWGIITPGSMCGLAADSAAPHLCAVQQLQDFLEGSVYRQRLAGDSGVQAATASQTLGSWNLPIHTTPNSITGWFIPVGVAVLAGALVHWF